MKTRISCLHIADYSPAFPGTFIDSLIYLGKELEKGRYRLILILPSFQKWHDLLTKNNIDVLCVPVPSLARPWEVLKYLFRLRRIVIKENVKIIHCHHNLKYLSFAKLFVGRGVKVIWHWRNVPNTIIFPRSNFIKTLFRDFFYKAVSTMIDRHIAISSELYDWLSSISKKVSFIPNGVSLERFDLGILKRDDPLLGRLGIPKDAVVVGSVANFRPVKDHSTLLKAAGEVIKQRPAVYFVLAGDGPTRAQAEEFSQRLGISGHVVFTGVINDPESLVYSCDVIVLSTFSEAFPSVLLEAMALERPVVATDVGGCRDIVAPGTGFLVGVKEHMNMANKILWLLDNPQKAKEMGREGRKIVETKFSMAIWSKRVIDLYEGR